MQVSSFETLFFNIHQQQKKASPYFAGKGKGDFQLFFGGFRAMIY